MATLHLTRFVEGELGRLTMLRIGRLVLRTHPRHVMWAPSGYRSSRTVWAVEWPDDDEQPRIQLGVFSSQKVARTCMQQLHVEGREDLALNILHVHHRLKDWEWDR